MITSLKKRKLEYRFHNPNSVEDTADFLAKLFIEVNKPKVERAIREAMESGELEKHSRDEAR